MEVGCGQMSLKAIDREQPPEQTARVFALADGLVEQVIDCITDH